MMYRLNLSHFSISECEKIRKDLQPYAWEIYDVSYRPPVIDIHWNSEKSIKELFPDLLQYMTIIQ